MRGCSMRGCGRAASARLLQHVLEEPLAQAQHDALAGDREEDVAHALADRRGHDDHHQPEGDLAGAGGLGLGHAPQRVG